MSTGKLAGMASGSGGIVISTTAGQIIVTTAGLVSVAGKGPTSAVIFIRAAFAKKTSLAMSLAALADLVASGLTTGGLLASTAATRLTAVLLAGSIAQLVVSGYQAHQACTAPG